MPPQIVIIIAHLKIIVIAETTLDLPICLVPIIWSLCPNNSADDNDQLYSTISLKLKCHCLPLDGRMRYQGLCFESAHEKTSNHLLDGGGVVIVIIIIILFFFINCSVVVVGDHLHTIEMIMLAACTHSASLCLVMVVVDIKR